MVVSSSELTYDMADVQQSSINVARLAPRSLLEWVDSRDSLCLIEYNMVRL